MKSLFKFKRLSSLVMKKTFIILMVGTFSFINTFAQGFDELGNPQVKVKINHPPSLGLKVDKVIFNPSTGNCSDQIVDALISDFVDNDVEVIDRDNLQTILSEHDFSLSGYVDKNSAISIGKIIGPSAMITVKVLRCNTVIKDNLYKDLDINNINTQ